MPANTKHASYSAMLHYWTLMDDITACEKHMHEQGEKYITRLDKMDDAQYQAYVNRANFPLYTKHVLQNFVGMSMRKDVMTTKIPDELLTNTDSKGKGITEYTKNVVQHYLKYGRCGTLVEFGNNSKRSKLVFYDASSIINWNTTVINDVEQLSLVVLQEYVDASEDEFDDSKELRFRVLSLDKETNVYTQRLFDKDNIEILEKRRTPQSFFKPLKFIPFVIHGDVDVQYPPLLPIAEQNIAYYRLDADYKHGLHYTALPTPYTTGVDPNDKNKPTTIGPTEVWHLPDGATAGMLEFSGKGLGEIAKEKDKIDETIVILSSRILAPPKTINETATAASIRNASETASLADVVGMLSREMTVVVNLAINWTSKVAVEGVELVINNDFIPTILSGADVASYVASFLKGGMSYRTLFTTLKKGEIVEGDRLLTDELADIKKEAAERTVLEVDKAEKIGKVTQKSEQDPIKQGKKGEQVNKGRLTEN